MLYQLLDTYLFVVPKFAVAISTQIIIIRPDWMDRDGLAQIMQREFVRYKYGKNIGEFFKYLHMQVCVAGTAIA